MKAKTNPTAKTTNAPKNAAAPVSNAEKDPSTWATGAEPMTGAQHSYLKTLSDEAGVELDDHLNKAEASEQIEKLQSKGVVQERREVPEAGGASNPGVSNTQKDPATWATGGEPMTGAQHSYLKTLSDEAGVEIDDSLTKGEASQRIDELRQSNPRAQADAT